jgi:predicted nucleotidyltransferase component of viral defense system
MSFDKNFNTWKKENNLHGPMALNKYVMSLFIDDLANRFDDKYIFKGGNLLWYYIKTPRPTVDIDFATDTHIEYDSVVKDFCSVQIDSVRLSLLKQERVSKTDKEAINFASDFKQTQEPQIHSVLILF